MSFEFAKDDPRVIDDTQPTPQVKVAEEKPVQITEIIELQAGQQVLVDSPVVESIKVEKAATIVEPAPVEEVVKEAAEEEKEVVEAE